MVGTPGSVRPLGGGRRVPVGRIFCTFGAPVCNRSARALRADRQDLKFIL